MFKIFTHFSYKFWFLLQIFLIFIQIFNTVSFPLCAHISLFCSFLSCVHWGKWMRVFSAMDWCVWGLYFAGREMDSRTFFSIHSIIRHVLHFWFSWLPLQCHIIQPDDLCMYIFFQLVKSQFMLEWMGIKKNRSICTQWIKYQLFAHFNDMVHNFLKYLT